METRIANSEFLTDASATNLKHILEKNAEELGLESPIFYYDFPLFRDDQNILYKSKVLLVSRNKGLFLFGLLMGGATIDDKSLSKVDLELSQLDTILFSKLIRCKNLRLDKRNLALPVTSTIYAIDLDDEICDAIDNENPILKSESDVLSLINDTNINCDTYNALEDAQWDELISTIEGARAIMKIEERDFDDYTEDNLVYVLSKIEEKIANFDVDQRRAAITNVQGPQRIRGIAGSGKTIVLAMKAAYLHLNNPEAQILFTFWTKSLYDVIKSFITRFYRQFNDKDPDWTKLNILHAWGGHTQEGVYFNACQENGFIPLNFKNVKNFDEACKKLINKKPFTQKYSYVLIDEGQDLPPSFYQLCYALCKGGQKDRNIIWAYDELQTIMDTIPQDVICTFGYIDNTNIPKMDLKRAERELSNSILEHDIVLKKSYRNPPEILLCAHALGMSIYGDQIIQMLESKEHWEDLGYIVESGGNKPGDNTKILRPKINSPLDLAEYVPQETIIETHVASEFEREIEWICQDIQKFIDEGLLPEDIIVISLDDRNNKSYFSAITQHLALESISVNNIMNANYGMPNFFVEGHVTLSSVYRAKGNEAAVVYCVGVDALARSLDGVRVRNKLFTAFTRSRAWLRVTGISPSANQIIQEINTALENYPYLNFIYPDKEQITTIQRDYSEKSALFQELQDKMTQLEFAGMSKEEQIKILSEIPKK